MYILITFYTDGLDTIREGCRRLWEVVAMIQAESRRDPTPANWRLFCFSLAIFCPTFCFLTETDT